MFESQSCLGKRVFLARHGESLANQQKFLSGQQDTELSEKGMQQAQWLCEILQFEKLSAIYTSSLRRTIATAQPTANYHGIGIQIIDNLKEIALGDLEGKEANKPSKGTGLLQAGRANATQSTFGAEDLNAFQSRVLHCLDQLLQELEGTALIVGHRNTNEIILRRLLSSKTDSLQSINVKNKYLYEISLSNPAEIQTIRLGGEFHGKRFLGLKDD